MNFEQFESWDSILLILDSTYHILWRISDPEYTYINKQNSISSYALYKLYTTSLPAFHI